MSDALLTEFWHIVEDFGCAVAFLCAAVLATAGCGLVAVAVMSLFT